jgi:hypothetical protein
MNIVLALFNLLPGFPLDGGRILRSGLWKWTKDFRRSTRWATNAGIGVALGFVITGLGLMIWGDLFSGGWIAFVGVYLGMAAKEGYRQVDLAGIEDEIQLEQVAGASGKDVFFPPSSLCRSTLLVRVVDPSQTRFLITRRVDNCLWTKPEIHRIGSFYRR